MLLRLLQCRRCHCQWCCWWWLLVTMAVVVVHGWLVIEGWKRDVFAFLLVSCLLFLFSERATSHKTTYDVWCPKPNRFLVNWPTYKSHKAKTLWLLLCRMDDTTEARATLTSVQTWLAKMSCVSPEPTAKGPNYGATGTATAFHYRWIFSRYIIKLRHILLTPRKYYLTSPAFVTMAWTQWTSRLNFTSSPNSEFLVHNLCATNICN